VSFVVTAAILGFWCFLIAACLFYLSARTPASRSVINVKWLLFAGALCYLVLSHFGIYIAIGQGLDENYQAPCTWLLQNETTDGNLTTYAYADTCADVTAPEGSTALVVVFTWLFFILSFITFFGVMIQLMNATRRLF